MQKTIRYCQACKKRHSLEVSSWVDWDKKILGKKTVYYCPKGMDCAGCKMIHTRTPSITHCTRQDRETGEKITGWYCEKWVGSSPPSMAQRMSGMSPQDVVSGVHLGMPRQEIWGKDTEDYSTEVAPLKQELAQALEEI